MEDLGDFFKSNLSNLQVRLEDTLDVELGKIKILPINSYIDYLNEKNGVNNPIKKIVLKGIGRLYTGLNETFNEFIKYNDSAIFYGVSRRVRGLSESDMTFQALYGLGFIAIARMTGNSTEQLNDIPAHISHGFSTYNALNIMFEMKMVYFQKEKSAFPKLYNQFNKDITSKGITDLNGIKEYVVSSSNLSV